MLSGIVRPTALSISLTTPPHHRCPSAPAGSYISSPRLDSSYTLARYASGTPPRTS
jgi:hypothetical protein